MTARRRSVAIAGLGYTTVVLVGLARASVSDIADQFGYGILPLGSYVAMLAMPITSDSAVWDGTIAMRLMIRSVVQG